jgi:hypothetical protein
MNDDPGSQGNLSVLKRKLEEAEAAFRRASSTEAFQLACKQLRDAAAGSVAASEAAKKAEAEYLKSQNIHTGDLLDKARRVSQGVPRLQDLRQIVFPQSPANAHADLLTKAETTAAEEARARNKLSIALDVFNKHKDALIDLASECVQWQLACESAQGLDTAYGYALEALTLEKVLGLPEVKGLETYIVPG